MGWWRGVRWGRRCRSFRGLSRPHPRRCGGTPSPTDWERGKCYPKIGAICGRGAWSEVPQRLKPWAEGGLWAAAKPACAGWVFGVG
jgi:hypothetical protein